ncbi:excisionase family DNA binding protein [Tamaricihabitans halophyticus]|uniref:Excisionase family DNA binding protein n=1 Tax=Tamaricihabitans halophyticus TaxID=1262583 RepID=A0A4R2PT86_9PSEU|nr:excisionase family DNA binding protein [Tamaricihabitans halophyticus]
MANHYDGVPRRHLYRIPEALQLLSMSRSVFYQEVRARRLRTVKQGKNRLVPHQSIEEYVELLVAKEDTNDQAA